MAGIDMLKWPGYQVSYCLAAIIGTSHIALSESLRKTNFFKSEASAFVAAKLMLAYRARVPAQAIHDELNGAVSLHRTASAVVHGIVMDDLVNTNLTPAETADLVNGLLLWSEAVKKASDAFFTDEGCPGGAAPDGVHEVFEYICADYGARNVDSDDYADYIIHARNVLLPARLRLCEDNRDVIYEAARQYAADGTADYRPGQHDGTANRQATARLARLCLRDTLSSVADDRPHYAAALTAVIDAGQLDDVPTLHGNHRAAWRALPESLRDEFRGDFVAVDRLLREVTSRPITLLPDETFDGYAFAAARSVGMS